MTREEQIAVAFDDYSDARKLSTFDDFEYTDIQVAFEEGAEWADANPKSQWISVDDDLPCNHKELITKDGITTMSVPTISYDGLLELHNMVKVMSSKGGDRWIWEEGFSPQYWFNLPNLK